MTVEGRAGFVLRPNIVGALVMKAAAHTAAGDAARGRHRRDFATLAALIAARDFRNDEVLTDMRSVLTRIAKAASQPQAVP